MQDTLATVYGTESVRIAQEIVETVAETGFWMGNGWFQALSTVVLVLWCVMIYRFRRQAAICLKGFVDFKAKERDAEHARLYGSFTNYAVGISIASMGLAVVKALPGFVDPSRCAPVQEWLSPVAAMVVAAVAAAVIVLGFGILKLAGSLTFSGQLAGELVGAKKTHLAAAAVLVVPPVLLYTGLNPAWDTVMMYIAAIEIIAIIFAFAIKTCILFVRQKVSLLVWFLYLCAVEIFPISFIILLAIRSI